MVGDHNAGIIGDGEVEQVNCYTLNRDNRPVRRFPQAYDRIRPVRLQRCQERLRTLQMIHRKNCADDSCARDYLSMQGQGSPLGRVYV